MGEKGKEFLLDVLYDIAGGIVFAVGLGCFVGPAQIAPGGVSGLAILANHLFGLPVGTVNLGINIPLLLLAWRLLGRRFTLKTLRSVFLQSLMIDLVALWLPEYTGDRIMAALFGGVAIGIGLAPVFMRGSTTGGTDIVSRLIQLRFRHVSIGKLLFLVDLAILLLSVAVFRNIETGLYGMICIYTSGRIVDGILYGLDTGKVVLVVSEKHQEIAGRVMDQLERGATFLHGSGAWSGEDKRVLLCAVRANQCYRVEEIVRGADPDAFLIILEANEIVGEGFRPITSNKIT
ncbi:MAG: YitT family protein [Angelakisella sp.]|jgi:uncharacterized membrane-anchored protein YitT (DUF2179 family)|nr:YitT family protein [Angelakisella sp.]